MLDEPTSGLDPLVQQTFYELIREAKAEGRTVFLSSHILSEVEKTCDRVAIIRDGRLVRSTGSRRCATSPTTRSSSASPATSRRPRSRPARRERRRRSTTTRCGCACAARSPRSSSAAAGYDLARLRQSRAVLEETFLAEYGRSGRRGGLTWRPMTATADAGPRRARSRCVAGCSASAASSARPSAIRAARPDRRRGLLGVLLIGVSEAIVQRVRHARRRAKQLGDIVAAVPPILAGLAGKPVNVETLGGYL